MKKILITGLLSLAFFSTTFSATSMFFDDGDCKKDCPPKSARGCAYKSCFYTTSNSGQTVTVSCSYETDCGPAPVETPAN